MCWNDCYERKKFNSYLNSNKHKYKKYDMSNENILAMEIFDTDLYNKERSYYEHKIEFDELIDEDQENNFMYQYTSDNYINSDFRNEYFDQFLWIEEIENQLLYKSIKTLNDDQKKLLTYKFLYNLPDTYIAKEILGISSPAITYRMRRIYIRIKQYIEVNRNENIK